LRLLPISRRCRAIATGWWQGNQRFSSNSELPVWTKDVPPGAGYLAAKASSIPEASGGLAPNNVVKYPAREVIASAHNPERCQSGRLGRSRKPVTGLPVRGFESLPLRLLGSILVAASCFIEDQRRGSIVVAVAYAAASDGPPSLPSSSRSGESYYGGRDLSPLGIYEISNPMLRPVAALQGASS
jgi:hypothetical protein